MDGNLITWSQLGIKNFDFSMRIRFIAMAWRNSWAFISKYISFNWCLIDRYIKSYHLFVCFKKKNKNKKIGETRIIIHIKDLTGRRCKVVKCSLIIKFTSIFLKVTLGKALQYESQKTRWLAIIKYNPKSTRRRWPRWPISLFCTRFIFNKQLYFGG